MTSTDQHTLPFLILLSQVGALVRNSALRLFSNARPLISFVSSVSGHSLIPWLSLWSTDLLSFSLFHSHTNTTIMYLNIPNNKPVATTTPVARPRMFSAINGVITVAK